MAAALLLAGCGTSRAEEGVPDGPVTISDFATEDKNLPRAVEAVEDYIAAYAAARVPEGVAVGPARTALEIRAALERTRGRDVESPYSALAPLRVTALGEDFVLVEGGMTVDKEDNTLTDFEVAVIDGDVAVRSYLVDGTPVGDLVAAGDDRARGTAGDVAVRVPLVGRDTDGDGLAIVQIANRSARSAIVDVGRSRIATPEGRVYPTGFAGAIGPLRPGETAEFVMGFAPATTPQGTLQLVVRDPAGPGDQRPLLIEVPLPRPGT